MPDNWSLRPTGCTSSCPAAASTWKCCCGSAAEDSPDTAILKITTNEKTGDTGSEYSHSSLWLVWKRNLAIWQSNRKKSKTIMCFKSILDFTVLFLLPAAFFHHFLLFIWLLVTLLTQWDYMIVIKITRATGLPPLKAQTIIPYMGEVKVWLTIWFGDHLSYISVLATTGLAPSIYKELSSNHNSYSKKATFGYPSCNLMGITQRIHLELFVSSFWPIFPSAHFDNALLLVGSLLSTI